MRSCRHAAGDRPRGIVRANFSLRSLPPLYTGGQTAAVVLSGLEAYRGNTLLHAVTCLCGLAAPWRASYVFSWRVWRACADVCSLRVIRVCRGSNVDSEGEYLVGAPESRSPPAGRGAVVTAARSLWLALAA